MAAAANTAPMKRAVFNWSGGKDSSMSLYAVLRRKQFDIRCLLTSVNTRYQRVSMHGVRLELIKAQAESIGIPLHPVWVPEAPTMAAYDELMFTTLRQFKDDKIEYSIFGDIFLEDLKKYREGQLAKVQMQAVFPIWQRPTIDLATEFIDLGFRAVIACVNDKYLDKSFAGREIDRQFLKDLPAGVDPCGENGEYHSFVFDGPIFKKPLAFRKGELVYRKYKTPAESSLDDNGFWYCDLI